MSDTYRSRTDRRHAHRSTKGHTKPLSTCLRSHGRKPTPKGVMCLAAVRLHRRFFAAAIDSVKTGSAAGSTRRQRHVFMVTAAGLSSSVLRECVSAAAAATFTWSSSKKVQAGRSGVAERRAGARRSRRSRGPRRRREGQHEGLNRGSHRQMKGVLAIWRWTELGKSERRVSHCGVLSYMHIEHAHP